MYEFIKTPDELSEYEIEFTNKSKEIDIRLSNDFTDLFLSGEEIIFDEDETL